MRLHLAVVKPEPSHLKLQAPELKEINTSENLIDNGSDRVSKNCLLWIERVSVYRLNEKGKNNQAAGIVKTYSTAYAVIAWLGNWSKEQITTSPELSQYLSVVSHNQDLVPRRTVLTSPQLPSQSAPSSCMTRVRRVSVPPLCKTTEGQILCPGSLCLTYPSLVPNVTRK
jgi:hypothetical protein